METLLIVVAAAVAAAVVGTVAYRLGKLACHHWNCGSIKRKWKRREPNSDDYDLHTTNRLSEYDRYYTDVNDWRLSGEKEVREHGPDDC